MVRKDSALKEVEDVDRPGIKIGVGLASVYDLFLTRTLKHATLVRAKIGGAAAGIGPFLEQNLDVAAGVREPFDDYAKDHPDMRVMKGRFRKSGKPWARQGSARRVRPSCVAFIEEMKANGFVADALKHSGQTAPVAPPEM